MHTRQTKSRLNTLPGIHKPLSRHHKEQTSERHAIPTKSENALPSAAESDTATSSFVPKNVDPQGDAQSKQAAPTSPSALTMQLQLPRSCLTMAMTCCDLDDSSQDTGFLSSSPNCYNTSDFVFFSTVTDHCQITAQAKEFQHDYFQTVPVPTASETCTAQQPNQASPQRHSQTPLSSDSVTSMSKPQHVPSKQQTSATRDFASHGSPPRHDAASSRRVQPPPTPRRRLPERVFGRSANSTSPVSHLTFPHAPAQYLDLQPKPLFTPNSILQALLENHKAQLTEDGLLQTQSSAAELEAELHRHRSTPVASANALLHKLLMQKDDCSS